MADDLIFNLALTGSDGKKIPFSFTKDGLRDLIVQMLSIAATAPSPPNLERQIVLDDTPIPSNGFMITPYEGDPTGGHVSIGIGPINLQFGVSLDALLQAFETLKSATEPDPTSFHRLN